MSNTLPASLPSLATLSGTFSVRDAWDKAPSGYVVTLLDGKLVSATIPNSPDLAFKLDAFPSYMARGFGLLHSLAACCYEPRGRANEEAPMLGSL